MIGELRMGEFEQEIKRRIEHCYYQLAAYADSYNNNEMELKEYVVECEKVKEKIRLLER